MGFISLLLYTLISIISGTALIVISLNSVLFAVDADRLGQLLAIMSTSPNNIATGCAGLLIILFCMQTLRGVMARNQREKTIAFEGNLGEVRVALSAVEDMIKKLLSDFKELKEIKPQVTASKKGVQVTLRVVLTAYISIPEFTARIQNLVRDKLQHMLGIEEEIRIKVEIKKIFPPAAKVKSPEEIKEEEEETPTVPYRNY